MDLTAPTLEMSRTITRLPAGERDILNAALMTASVRRGIALALGTVRTRCAERAKSLQLLDAKGLENAIELRGVERGAIELIQELEDIANQKFSEEDID